MQAPNATERCTFCDVIVGRRESSEVYSDQEVVAFMDVEPANLGHLLVVPRTHAASLDALDEQIGAQVFTVAQRLARALRSSGLPCDGVTMLLADGEVAGQEMPHVHLHVVPRRAGDGFRISARWLSPDRTDLDSAAALIRAELD